jgi:hypothetical protein
LVAAGFATVAALAAGLAATAGFTAGTGFATTGFAVGLATGFAAGLAAVGLVGVAGLATWEDAVSVTKAAPANPSHSEGISLFIKGKSYLITEIPIFKKRLI